MIHETFSNLKLPAMQVSCIGHSGDPAVTCWRPGRRPTLLIHYVTAGRGYFNGRPVRAGQGFLILPGELSEYRPHPREPWTYLWIIIRTDDPAALTCHFPADGHGIFEYDYADYVTAQFAGIDARMKQGDSPAENLCLFLNLLKKQLRRQTDGYATAARDYLESHYQQPLSVAALAGELHISQPYLYKVFTAAYGVSPKEYLCRYRLERAKELLAGTGLSVARVAEAVGYEDALAFSSFFRRRTGQSPRTYRKNAQNAEKRK